MSHNQISKLPDELAELQELLRLDISHNAFIALPSVVCRIPQLKRLQANNNSIIGNYKNNKQMNIFNYQLNKRNNSFILYVFLMFIFSFSSGLDVDAERIKRAPSLEFVDLRENTIPPRIYDLLCCIDNITIELSPRQVEDWEDLNI